MSITSLKVRIRGIANGSINLPGLPPHQWSKVESWVDEYIASNRAVIRIEELQGLKISPRDIFSRVAESTGYLVVFIDDNSFKFVQRGE